MNYPALRMRYSAYLRNRRTCWQFRWQALPETTSALRVTPVRGGYTDGVNQAVSR
jgi:hypothetical protein